MGMYYNIDPAEKNEQEFTASSVTDHEFSKDVTQGNMENVV